MATMAASSPKELIVYQRKRLHLRQQLSVSERGSVLFKREVPERVKQTKTRQPRAKKVAIDHPSNCLTRLRGLDQPWQPPETSLRAGWGTLRVGTSGYVYKDWKKIVYPEEVPQKEWFHWYTRLFDTVEINNTFYRLPSFDVIDGWRSQAPTGFCYALKFSRFGTHMKRLKEPEGPISLFLERLLRLGQQCTGPILVQLPPNFNVNVDRLKYFLEKVPKQYRWAIEFRDSRWLCNEIYSVLREHNAALCIHDHKDITSPHPQVFTADWTYIRFHGYNYQRYYQREELQTYASWIKEKMKAGLDVYAYFNNDYHGYAPFNALDLREMVLDAT